MRDKQQKFARGTTVLFDRDNFPFMHSGKKNFPQRFLKQSVFKLCLGWVISGDLNVRLYVKLEIQAFISDSNISNNNTI